MAKFNYSVSLDEQGRVIKKVRLIKYNSKILAFNINKPEGQTFFSSKDEFLESVKDCDPAIFEDLTGENILSVYETQSLELPKVANALSHHIIPEKRSQLRFE
ncbi:MAG: hypothetical protein JST55_16240 [Bacteroidetes bacterium]|nr:hypothetical protein [Bacteroidota bacterium]